MGWRAVPEQWRDCERGWHSCEFVCARNRETSVGIYVVELLLATYTELNLIMRVCVRDSCCICVVVQLGHNLPDGRGNRYCINLVSVAGFPVSPEDQQEQGCADTGGEGASKL